MRYLCLIFIFLIGTSVAQDNGSLSGTWQGVLIRAGQKMKDGTLIYLKLDVVQNKVSGKMREEIYGESFYAVKLIDGKKTNTGLTFRQVVTEKQSSGSRQKWCRYDTELSYDAATGYLSGTFEAYDCNRIIGKLILYRNDFVFSSEAESSLSHLWFEPFVKEFELGLNAPDIRETERKNFVFEPIYFDYDKADIRPEYVDFLNRMVKVVQGHSDLRVKVTGHTDADGSDRYNDELSRKRAKAIIDYFVLKGLSADRLVFDFKGEKQPIDNNNTEEGKQRNRRVDFQFI